MWGTLGLGLLCLCLNMALKSRGAKSGRSCEPSSQKIFGQILIWQKFFDENQAINVDYHIKHIL